LALYKFFIDIDIDIGQTNRGPLKNSSKHLFKQNAPTNTTTQCDREVTFNAMLICVAYSPNKGTATFTRLNAATGDKVD